jgi:hypothetical protein
MSRAMIVLYLTLFYLNTKRVLHDLEKNLLNVEDIDGDDMGKNKKDKRLPAKAT